MKPLKIGIGGVRLSLVDETGRIACPSERLSELVRKARHFYAEFPMDLRDGVKVMGPDSWFILRGSNTEPVLRVVAEAVDEASARELAESVRNQVTEWLE
jgi:phosphomannomutase